jgi:hypothetical protein
MRLAKACKRTRPCMWSTRTVSWTISEHKVETSFFRDDHEWIVGFEISLGVLVVFVISVALMLVRSIHTYRIASNGSNV